MGYVQALYCWGECRDDNVDMFRCGIASMKDLVCQVLTTSEFGHSSEWKSLAAGNPELIIHLSISFVLRRINPSSGRSDRRSQFIATLRMLHMGKIYVVGVLVGLFINAEVVLRTFRYFQISL